MRSKLVISALLASALFIPAALAQQTPSPSANNPPAPAAVPAPMTAPAPAARSQTTVVAPMAQSGQWRASKLMGLNVYNEQNEKLGDINEILLDQSGKVTGVVIGVGGFLGMGQRDIMVTMDKIKFVNEPVRTSATTTNTTGSAANAPAARNTATTARNANEKWYPDHAVLSGATKDQLKTMTEFKYN